MTDLLIVAIVVLLAAGMEILAAQRSTWLHLFCLETRWKIASLRESLALFCAHLLPRWLVEAAAVRLVAHATVGRYSNTLVPELTAIEALKRWSTPND